MIAIAVMTRDGAHSCSGNVQTPLGNGPSRSRQGFGSNGQGDQITYAASLGTACRLNKACFAVAIVGAVLFLLSALFQVFLMRHHKKEKRFGPSPGNNYTSGSSKKRFGFGRKKNNTAKSAEAGALPANNRVSNETGYTGTTVGGGAYDNYDKTASRKTCFGGPKD